MAIQNFTLPNPCFLSQLPSGKMYSPALEYTDYVLLKIKRGNSTFYTETYNTDQGGGFYLFDLDKIIRPYLTDSDTFTFEFRLSVSQQISTFTYTARILPATCPISIPAAEFVSANFLTRTSHKTIPAHAHELLHLCIPSEHGDYAICAETKILRNGTFTKQDIFIEGGVWAQYETKEFDVSPTVILARLQAADHLVSYTIHDEGGSIEQHYTIAHTPTPEACRVLYRNAFGVMETLYIPGVLTEENNYDRSNARILGNLHTYRNVLTKTFTCTTAIMSDTDRLRMEELFLSEEVYLLNEYNEQTDRIVFTEVTDKQSHSPYSIIGYEFSYQLSRQNHLAPAENYINTFDQTFDQTFS